MAGQRNEQRRRYSVKADNVGVKRRNSSDDGDQPLIGSEDTVYRYLCPVRKTGSIIGKGGDVVKQIRAESMANIKISEVTAGSDERIITIFSSSEETSFLEESGELLSPAQVALFMVHSRIVREERGSDDDEFAKPRQVVVRMLVPSDQIGCVIGRSGQVIQDIRIESGAQIRILKDNYLHPFALPTDQLLQIIGEPDVANQALHLIASRLHENPSRSQYLLLSPSMMNVKSNVAVVGSYDQREEISAKEFSLRLVCRTENIGAVIGKGGGIIRQIRQESRASVKVDSSTTEGDDCIIFISAKESFEEYSPTMIAALALQPRCSERAEKESGVSVLTTRILVHRSQIGCLMGKGGSIISDMRNVTRANIRILSRTDIPSVASEDDELVQIVGGHDVATNALSQIILRLKANLFGLDGALTPIVPILPHVPMFNSFDRHPPGLSYASDLASQANYGSRETILIGSEGRTGEFGGSSFNRSGVSTWSSKRRSQGF